MTVLESFNLSGKVAIVTGGAGHLGRALSEALYEAGARVYVFGRSEEKFISCGFDNERVAFIQCNILSSESIKKCYEQVYCQSKQIDILVNCAATLSGAGRLPEDIDDDMWNYTAEGVLASSFKCVREVIPYMRHQGGKIINISSMYGVVSPDLSMYNGECKRYLNSVHYGAMKAGVIQMTKYMAAYLIEDGINVNCITPGTFPKPAVQDCEEFVSRLQQKNPAHRLGRPEDMKGALLLLASSASDYIVGQNIIIDGGWTIW